MPAASWRDRPGGCTMSGRCAPILALPPRRRQGTRVTTARTVLVLNGPNLNLLGTREPAVYGSATLAGVGELCPQGGGRYGLVVEARQSNHEGELVDWVQEAGRRHTAG